MDKHFKVDKMFMDIMSGNLWFSMLPGSAAWKTKSFMLQKSRIYHSLWLISWRSDHLQMLINFNIFSKLNAVYYCLEAYNHNIHMCIMKPFSLYHTEYNMLHSDILCCLVAFLVELYMIIKWELLYNIMNTVSWTNRLIAM